VTWLPKDIKNLLRIQEAQAFLHERYCVRQQVKLHGRCHPQCQGLGEALASLQLSFILEDPSCSWRGSGMEVHCYKSLFGGPEDSGPRLCAPELGSRQLGEMDVTQKNFQIHRCWKCWEIFWENLGLK